MSKNKQQDPQQTLKVENYEFEPIKGYPMLNWKGKRPFTSTQYFPAQLKESYGKPDANGWMNKIFWGDNLQVMSHLLKEYRGKVDLIYIDPPFDSNVDYKKTISIKSAKEVKNDYHAFEEKQYSDLWAKEDFLQFMYERLILMRELISDTGSIFLHCDWRMVHLLKLIMDEVFGPENFRNDIRWKRQPPRGAKANSKQFARSSDSILYYSKSENRKWHSQYKPYDQKYIDAKFTNKDKNGRLYRIDNIGDYSKSSIAKFREEGKIYDYPSGKIGLIRYLDEAKGEALTDIWVDINEVNSQANDRLNYPTQKPEVLIERIINATTDVGDIVFDCFMGSGTTQIAALNTNRRFLGADINLGAIVTSTKRLAEKIQTRDKNFQVLNVNNYDLFRNPIEAHTILMSALEISALKSSMYDGEKDGRMVKIMPINRIASKGDLGDLIAGFDYKSFEKRQKENPNKAVEKILLVCMGHEPDLRAHLEKEVNYKLDIEIVDILRDKQDLQFKRESEAKIKIKKDKLIIEKFYPMNLLQKLSLQKEKVSDWKELVESVLIDWNYDGAVLEPQVIDIPEKNELVAGEYDVPKDAGTIRVKITDLLSESIEIEVGRE